MQTSKITDAAANRRRGLLNAYYQSTGKKAKSLKEAARHFGVKTTK